MALAAILSAILSWYYVRHGSSQSNRHSLANVFVLLAITTTLVITVVKSSLALSLGLVGALSIVRFRAAIKEPEELAFLFLAIAIGLGFGADQRLVTTIAFILVIIFFTVYRRIVRNKIRTWNFYLTATAAADRPVDIDAVTEILKTDCLGVTLKRYEKNDINTEAVFYLEFISYDSFEVTKKQLDTNLPDIRYMFVEDFRVL